MIVFDTVYNPETTLLVKEAKSHGCRTVTGVEMFVRQAALQFMLFTGAGGAVPADARDAQAGDRPGEVLSGSMEHGAWSRAHGRIDRLRFSDMTQRTPSS